MTSTGLRIKPLTPVLGAEIEGIDLDRQSADDLRAVSDALTQYQVIFFRDQDISVESQMALGAHFGELVAHPNDPGLDGHPEVMIIHADESSKRVAGESWHSDVSCEAEPPMGSILRIHTLPDTGGDTLFASMYSAYEALSEPVKAFLAGLYAVHDGAPYYRSVNQRIGRDDGGRSYPRALHPMVRTHPVSGRKALFVNEMFTTHVEGLTADESRAVLSMLFEHIRQPQFQCRFRWQKNSIAFWDNRCVQHQAIWDYWPQTRSGYRVTVKGDKPI
jgi:alpha-ketoglutarate-dependent taurine dioxygenase